MMGGKPEMGKGVGLKLDTPETPAPNDTNPLLLTNTEAYGLPYNENENGNGTSRKQSSHLGRAVQLPSAGLKVSGVYTSKSWALVVNCPNNRANNRTSTGTGFMPQNNP